ncbi:MAG: hypothetical protein Q4E99_03310, partial [Bacillota bacterium]|nr:hypothetical protein [Bacillota bacterium]
EEYHRILPINGLRSLENGVHGFQFCAQEMLFCKKHLPTNNEIRLFKIKISDEEQKALEYCETVVIIL